MKKNIIIRDHLHGKNSSLVFFHRHKICWMKWNKASEMISALLMTPPRYARLVYSFFKSFALKISFALWKLNSAAGFTARISESRQTQRVFLPPWSHQVGIHSMLPLCKLYTYQSSPFFHLHWNWCHRIKPSQWFVSSNSKNCSQNLGTAFLLVCCFPLYLSLLQAVVLKRGTVLISHSGKVSFLPQ